MRDKGLQNLVDFMVEDIMSMTDEEILAETTPEELEQVKQMQERINLMLDPGQASKHP